MLTRRDFATGLCGIGMTGLAPSGGSAYQLGPAVGVDWVRQQSETAPKLVQLGSGVQLMSGPMGAVDRNGLAIWSRSWWTQVGFQATFTTRKLDASAAAGAQELYLLLYFGVQGDGSKGHPAHLGDWAATTTPYSHAYASFIRGARISLYRQSPTANGETQPLEAAYFRADSSRNTVQGDTPVPFAGVRGQLYRWTVARAGNVVTVSQNDGRGIRKVTFTHPAFGTLAATGSFGFLVPPGRSVEVDDFAVAPLTRATDG